MATSTLLRADSNTTWTVPSSLPSAFTGALSATGGVARYGKFIDPSANHRDLWIAQCHDVVHNDHWAWSPDGDTWTETHSVNGTTVVQGVLACVNDGSTVPTNGFGIIIRDAAGNWFGSNDGVTWTSITAPASVAPTDPGFIVYGNGLYLVAGGGAVAGIQFSADFGHTWHALVAIGTHNESCLGVGYDPSNTTFYAYTNGGSLNGIDFWTSTTLTSWTNVLTITSSVVPTLNNGFFEPSSDLTQVLWCSDEKHNGGANENQLILTGNHGSTWTQEGTPIAAGVRVQAAVWDHVDSLWLAFTGANLDTSSNGTTWSSESALTGPGFSATGTAGIRGIDRNPNNQRMVLSGIWTYTQVAAGTPGWRIGRPGLAFNQNTAWAVR